jgi:hypothetical protein
VTRDEFFAELHAAADKLPSADARASAHAQIDELRAMEDRAGPSVASTAVMSQRSLDERWRELERLSAEVAEKSASLRKKRSRRTRSRTEEFILGAILFLAVLAFGAIILRAW